MDASNNLIGTGGYLNAHWTYNDPNTQTNGPAQITTPQSVDWFYHGTPNPSVYGWSANGPTSDWIAINANTAQNGNVNDNSEPNPGAPYTFSRSFIVTGEPVGSLFHRRRWGIDDEGTLSLNGNTISTLTNANAYIPNDWSSLTSFTIPAGDLQTGLNTFTITMTFADNEDEAVRFEGTVSGDVSDVPEPSALVRICSLLGTLGIGLAWWRRRKAA